MLMFNKVNALVKTQWLLIRHFNLKDDCTGFLKL